MSALVSDRNGQSSRRDSNVPWWLGSEPQHASREQRPSLFHGTQCPVRASTLYLPDNILACVVATGCEDWVALGQAQVLSLQISERGEAAGLGP